MVKCGIYKIQNQVNNKIYIGQSVNIDRRIKEHRSRSEQQIDLAIKKYGFDNFVVEIIQECEPEQLNELEQYYINYYDCLQPKGYNVAANGYGSAYGELNNSCTIPDTVISQIRQFYRNKTYKSATEMWKNNYRQYSETYIISIFYGYCRTDIDMDVYKDTSLQEYYRYNLTHSGARRPGELNPASVVSNKDALQMRILYQTKDKYAIIRMFPQYSERTIVSILMGQNWKHLPIYRKRKYKDREVGWEYPPQWSQSQIDDFIKEFLHG